MCGREATIRSPFVFSKCYLHRLSASSLTGEKQPSPFPSQGSFDFVLLEVGHLYLLDVLVIFLDHVLVEGPRNEEDGAVVLGLARGASLHEGRTGEEND